MTPAQADLYAVQRSCHTLSRSYPVSAGAHRRQGGSYYARRLAQAVEEFSQASRSMQIYELQKQLKLNGTGINIGGCGVCVATFGWVLDARLQQQRQRQRQRYPLFEEE
jgi:hypothetical protein